MYATARHPGAGWPGAEALLWEEDCGTMNWFTGTAPVSGRNWWKVIAGPLAAGREELLLYEDVYKRQIFTRRIMISQRQRARLFSRPS